MSDEPSAHEDEQCARIVIADDHPLMRDALKSLVKVQSNLEVIGEATNGREALELCLSLRPEVVLLDLRMPEMDGVAATRAIKRELPNTAVLIITAVGDPNHLLPIGGRAEDLGFTRHRKLEEGLARSAGDRVQRVGFPTLV